MDVHSLLSSRLSPGTLKKVAWYLKVPSSQSVDEYFLSAPLRDEVATITAFSKYTRGIAGEDPDAPPDDAEEERRWRQMYAAHHHSVSNGQSATTTNNNNVMTTTTTTTTTTTSTTASAPSASNAATSNGTLERPAKQTGAAAKRRKTQAGNGGERASAAQTQQQQFPIVEEGRKVAAKLEDGWMMMTVLKFNKRNRMYTLEDADDQAEEKEEHEVPRDLVVPLACPEYTPPLFASSARVLAVYPGTTSFYPAIVQKAMKRPIPSAKQTGKPVYDYMLQFEDDDEGSDGETVPRKVKGDFVIEEVVV